VFVSDLISSDFIQLSHLSSGFSFVFYFTQTGQGFLGSFYYITMPPTASKYLPRKQWCSYICNPTGHPYSTAITIYVLCIYIGRIFTNIIFFNSPVPLHSPANRCHLDLMIPSPRNWKAHEKKLSDYFCSHFITLHVIIQQSSVSFFVNFEHFYIISRLSDFFVQLFPNPLFTHKFDYRSEIHG
jgi:hypothetical protein